MVKQNKDFLVRCDEQIAKRDQIIEKYQKNQVEITKKQALKKQLEEFVIPQLPEKQTNVPNEEELRLLVEQQKLIQQRMRTLEEYETTRKYSKLCREQQDKVDMLSLAAKTLDAKVGVKGIILQVYHNNRIWTILRIYSVYKPDDVIICIYISSCKYDYSV